ncbi:glycoside hydrolase [Schizopora paradoxa]|uniref:mannan endo-1,4-beta-mannosidase n=1 Tax=Schizopora paradoxa TaxID=27342 RepID=A0A0H2SJU3_9AGAM|nr:glycoside hydrolase [Schizopora paradoxa]
MRRSFASLVAATWVLCASAVVVPPGLAEFTGLSSAELKRLISPSDDALTPRDSTCAFNDTSGGVFTGPASPSAKDLLKRNSFVTREGTSLQLLGEPFRMVGANIYWLGLDENVIPDPSYPSKQRVLEAFADVSVMRGSTVRGHTLGISVGNPLSVEPSLDFFNDAAYESIDFAITVARVYGIKLLIPLIDNYNYYHGGKYQFIEWNGIPFNGTGADITPPDVGAFFYNTTRIVNSFKRYVTQHLNHVNQFTGIALKDDPTILGWESGNELSGARFGDGPAPAAWTKEIGELIKSFAPKQLFMDGSYGIFPETGQLENEVVDIFSDHFYPPNITRFSTGFSEVSKAGRNYLAGEYDWTGLNGGDDLTTFLSTIKDSKGAGDIFWSLFGHDDACCEFVEHDDGESFYYLRQNTTNLYIDRGDIIIDHAAEMTGSKVPETMPAVACPQFAFPKDLLPHGFSP